MDKGVNEHIWEYLKYYIDLKYAPQSAVLINGPWGIGKTFLIKKFARETLAGPDDHVYVSLHGLSTIDELDAAILQAMYPLLNHKGVQFAGKIGKAALKFLKFDPDLKPGDLLRRFSPKLYVFDDLERCEMPPNKVLGYINEFVEHEGAKVLIIAYETEIKDQDAYRHIKEKVIGKTLEITSSFDEAYAFFLTRLEHKATVKFLTDHKRQVSGLYANADMNNLRILQQTMREFDRLFTVLDDRHLKRSEAMLALLNLFFAISFELKANRLTPTDLVDRRMSAMTFRMAAKKEDPKPRFIVATERYPTANLEDTILSDKLLIDILSRGIVEKGAILATLEQDPRFAGKRSERPWRVLWHGFDRTEEEFNQALATVEKQYSDHQFVVVGEVLHVFGIRLWLSDLGILELTRTQVLEEGKAYIDYLYGKENLARHLTDQFLDSHRMTGYSGLGFMEGNTPEFAAMVEYATDKWEKSKDQVYPEATAALLDELKAEPGLFYRRLNLTNDDDNTYFAVPILHKVDIQAFIDILMTLHPSVQRMTLSAIAERYKHGALGRELSVEKPWLISLTAALKAKIETLAGIPKIQLTRFIAWTIESEDVKSQL